MFVFGGLLNLVRNRLLIFSLVFFCNSNIVVSKELLGDSLKNPIRFELGLGINAIGSTAVPLWMRSNQYGNVPIEGSSISALGIIEKSYSEKNKIVDWGLKLNGRLNVGKQLQFIPLEAYLKGKLSILQIKIGRSYDREGLIDSLLSSGSFTLSGNALGIPKIELSIPEYYSLPLTSDFLSFKGNISYGWMGNIPIQYGDFSGSLLPAYYHHLSLYGRLGRPASKFKLYGAINHDVIWGSDRKIFGSQYSLNTIGEFWHVLSGKAYTPPSEFLGRVDISKIGNHLGSIDIGGEYYLGKFTINIYHQFFYEKGALAHFANLKDGLTGVVFSNNKKSKSQLNWRKFLLEFFYSKNQAGDYGAKWTPSGPEYYYNHAVYSKGFSYKGESIGTSLITPNKYARYGQINNPLNYFISNKVIALHTGFTFDYQKYLFVIKGTYAKHYGDYRTNGPSEQWFNGEKVKQSFVNGVFVPVNQFSGYAEVHRVIPRRNLMLSCIVSADYGKLLNNSIGTSLMVKKIF